MRNIFSASVLYFSQYFRIKITAGHTGRKEGERRHFRWQTERINNNIKKIQKKYKKRATKREGYFNKHFRYK